jgi:iron(III) transport system permease protein
MHSMIFGKIFSGRIVRFMILILLLLPILLPIGVILLLFCTSLVRGDVGITTQLVWSGRSGLLLLKSTVYAAVCSVSALLIGILYATAIPRFSRRVSRAMIVLIIALLPIPPYIHALAWNNVLSAFNTLISGTSYQPFALQGWVMAWWVQVMVFLPFSCLIGIIALHAVSRDLIDAARVVSPDITVLSKIMIPISYPLFSAGFGFLFLLGITEYSVPSLFSVDTYALDIFAAFSATNAIAIACAAAFPLIAVAVCVLVFCQPGIRALGEFPGWTGTGSSQLQDWPAWFSVLQYSAVILIVLQIGFLIFGTAGSIGSLPGVGAAISTSGREIVYSLEIGILAVLIGIPLAAGIVSLMPKEKYLKSVFWILVTLSLAIPSSLIGMGLLTLFATTPIGPITILFLPVLAGIIRFLPVAIIIISAQVHMIDPVLLDAARFLGDLGSASYRRVVAPMIAPGIFIAAVFLFALTLGELGATLLVAAPGHQTLTMKIYNYLHYGSFSAVAGLCILMAGITTIATLLTLFGISIWIKRFRLFGSDAHD